MNVVEITAILAKESEKTVRTVAHAVYRGLEHLTGSAYWTPAQILESDLPGGVKSRLNRRLAKVGSSLEAIATAGDSRWEELYGGLSAILSEKDRLARERARTKALAQCRDRYWYARLTDWLVNGEKLRIHCWSRSGGRNRLTPECETGELVRMLHLAAPDLYAQVEQKNDAPRGGANGDYYAYTGSPEAAIRFLRSVADAE